jgi:hypothetical protein
VNGVPKDILLYQQLQKSRLHSYKCFAAAQPSDDVPQLTVKDVARAWHESHPQDEDGNVVIDWDLVNALNALLREKALKKGEQ